MPDKKVILFCFTREFVTFVHALLTAMDFAERGWDVKVVVEGLATKFIPEVAEEEHALHKLFKEVKDRGLFDGACKACSTTMDVAVSVQRAGLRLFDEMHGHPSMAWYREHGYEVITF